LAAEKEVEEYKEVIDKSYYCAQKKAEDNILKDRTKDDKQKYEDICFIRNPSTFHWKASS
jgi:hypothetical protein